MIMAHLELAQNDDVPTGLGIRGLLGAQQAHATNEGSYKYGYATGFNDYNICSTAGTYNCDLPGNADAVPSRYT
jgi:hypothetical protein